MCVCVCVCVCVFLSSAVVNTPPFLEGQDTPRGGHIDSNRSGVQVIPRLTVQMYSVQITMCHCICFCTDPTNTHTEWVSVQEMFVSCC